MTQSELELLLKDLQALPGECEWVEFKSNNYKPDQGKRIKIKFL
jgi:hypothetical protein